MLPLISLNSKISMTKCVKFLRFSSTITYKQNQSDKVSHEFSPIYKFPQIFIGSILNKFKKIQLYIACGLIPASYGCYLGNLIDENLSYIIPTVGVASTVGIFAVGQLFNRMIGIVYLSKDGEFVKISYSDFWGKRIDEHVSSEDILPLSNSPRYITDPIFRKVFLTNSVKPLKISLKLGEIIDTEGFIHTFSYVPDSD